MTKIENRIDYATGQYNNAREWPLAPAPDGEGSLLDWVCREPELSEWQPIATVRSQEEVLVCNDCYLGWWAVAIQDALGGWHYADGRMAGKLKYEPTHWQVLPSIHPIAIRRSKAFAN